MGDQFPMFRLATLIARQVSSPIASRIKVYARGHEGAGRTACVAVARLLHAAELRLRLWSLRLPQPKRVPPMPENVALELGADLIGEIVVFSLGSAIVIFEVTRQAMKQENKVLNEKSAWVAVQLQVEELRRELELQQRDMDRLHAALLALAQPAPHSPHHPTSPAYPNSSTHPTSPAHPTSPLPAPPTTSTSSSPSFDHYQ